MNTNLLALVEFTQKIEALVNEAKAIGLNPEMSAHICALDPNFSNNVSQLMEMLSTTTPETTTTDTNKLVDELLKRVLTDQYQPQTPEPTEESTTETSTTEETTEEETTATTEILDYTSEWRRHHTIEGLELSTSGEARVNGSPVKIIMTNGYARGYNRLTH